MLGLTRREFSTHLSSLLSLTLVGHATPVAILPPSADDVTRTSEAIHQEVDFTASAARVYHALTDASEFTKLMAFGSMKDAAPAQIESQTGGTFSLFNGHIVGRHLELVPSQRLVQAWRVADWAPGAYSIARFELLDRGRKCTLRFDHTGFPNGLGEHLAQGWRMNYWQPLAKYLG